MKRMNTTQGQSLIEILFAIAVFTVGVVTIGYLIFDAFGSLRLATDSQKARFLAREGIEALQGIRAGGFDQLASGTHGLSFSEEGWALSGASDTTDTFERFLVIEDIDEETKRVTSNVVWGEGVQGRSVSFSTYLTNWQQYNGASKDLEYEINNAALTSSSTVLSGIALLNTGSEDLIITDLLVQWEGEPGLVEVSIREEEVYQAATSSPARPGETVDINDYAILPATGFHLIDLAFDAALSGNEFILTVVLSDGSRKHARITL